MIKSIALTIESPSSHYIEYYIDTYVEVDSLQQLINNFKKMKAKYPKYKIYIYIENICKECDNVKYLKELASIKKCREIWKQYKGKK